MKFEAEDVELHEAEDDEEREEIAALIQEIEMEFDPHLVIDGETGTLDIEIDPAAWYTNFDGTVVDLSAFDYATTGQVVELEAKFSDGFTKIELEAFND